MTYEADQCPLHLINNYYVFRLKLNYVGSLSSVQEDVDNLCGDRYMANYLLFLVNRIKSMMFLSKIIIPKMQKNNFGSMVHISSIDALSGDDKPQDAYGASKAAMIRLSKSLAIQFSSKNIRSNIILPGPIETGMQRRWKKNPKAKKNLEKFIPLKRVGKPTDIANTCMFLLSDQANYITGTEITVDGGITSKP